MSLPPTSNSVRTFVFTAESPQGGKRTVELVPASDQAAAVAELERRGLRMLALHDSWNQAALDLDWDQGRDATAEALAEEARKRGGSWRIVAAALRRELPLIVGAAAWAAWVLARGSISGFDWIPLIALPLLVIHSIWIKLPMFVQPRMQAAVDWARWDEAQRLIRIQRVLSAPFRITAVRMHLDMMQAKVLAGRGDLTRALATVSKWERGDAHRRKLYFGQVSSVYEAARDFRGAVTATEMAAELPPSAPEDYVDVAGRYIFLEHDVAGARAALGRVESVALAGLPDAYRTWVRGAIAVAGGEAGGARELSAGLEALRAAVPRGAPLPSAGFEAMTEAFLCLAEAARGRMLEAVAHFDRARPFLLARGYHDLLARCRTALSSRPAYR